ncbi:Phosphoglycerate kinase [Moraxella lacunata]|uniref:Phosphoglycerate kinase n=1 Tax=Moraxella lacunata TaxID=477 RepID=A0A378TU68_MORLA|nr:Phosphoglycerate kinase [Moraxella lacunata]
MSITYLSDLDVSGRTVLIREDLNVPIKDGVITSDVRLQASYPPSRHVLTKGRA